MITGRRLSIIFAGPPEARFDRKAWRRERLPLALAGSLRALPISHCDLDLPLRQPSVRQGALHAMCVLHFGQDDLMTAFRQRLAGGQGGPEPGGFTDTAAFTALSPQILGADTLLLGDGRRTPWRVRLLLPPAGREEAVDSLHEVTEEAGRQGVGTPIRRRELDLARCGLEPGSAPPRGGIATFYVDDREPALGLAAALRGLCDRRRLQGALVAASRVDVVPLDALAVRGADA